MEKKMRIKCPECGEEYDVSSSLLRKKAECAECSAIFTIKQCKKRCLKKKSKQKTLKEKITELKSELKKVQKYIEVVEKLDDIKVPFDATEEQEDRIGEITYVLDDIVAELEDGIEEIETEISSREEEIYQEWNNEDSMWCTKGIFKKPTKKQFNLLMDYLDKKYGSEWTSSLDDFEILHKGIEDLFPELSKN